MLKGKTNSGFEYEISDSTLNDYELLELFAEVDTKPILIVKIVNKMLGIDGKKRLADHLRLEDGTVPIDKMTSEVMEIMKSGKTKNSSSSPE